MAVLVIDDDKINLKILEGMLKGKYKFIPAHSGLEALSILEEGYKSIKCILLDLRMPGMNGMEFLKKIKANEHYKYTPVIIQTADTSKETILAGIAAGSFQYLLKPIEANLLLSHIQLAYQEYDRYFELLKNFQRNEGAFSLLEKAEFKFQTIGDGIKLSHALSTFYPNPTEAIVGIIDLFSNAVEHGNLDISFDEKSKLLDDGNLHDEIRSRLTLPAYRDKYVYVSFERTIDEIKLSIRDEGKGFDYKKYLSMDVSSVFLSHGRGIFMAKTISFHSLEYKGNGNEVETIVFRK